MPFHTSKHGRHHALAWPLPCSGRAGVPAGHYQYHPFERALVSALVFRHALLRLLSSGEKSLELIVRKIFAALMKPGISRQEFQTCRCQRGPGLGGFHDLKPTALFSRPYFTPDRPERLIQFLSGFVHGAGFKDGLEYAHSSCADNEFALIIFNPKFCPDSKGHLPPTL